MIDPIQLVCPHCSTRLRVREQLYVGRQIGCPECREALVIVEREAVLVIERIVIEEPARRGPTDRRAAGKVKAPAGSKDAAPSASAAKSGSGAAPVVTNRNEPGERSAARPELWRRPGVMGLALAVVGAIALLVIALTRGPRDQGESAGPIVAKNAGDAGAATDDGESQDEVGDVREPDKPAERPLEDRMQRLGAALLKHVEDQESFPAGTHLSGSLPPERRLSWMAALADQLEPSAKRVVVWDRAWDDPLNDAFVRRRIHAFQNPAVPQLVGADGYPASHFVGVAGVGADAARLDLRHPRAGIFGDDRRTRLDDIRDGTSQTMMVMGVTDQLGAWAAGGPATVRGLVREPYVNGPDGFGTGRPDAMLVLMADGRVQTVSAKVDPRILRRMAAMADGYPLDPDVAGEPGDQTPEVAVKVDELIDELVAEAPGEDDVPLEPEFAPEPPPARPHDIAAALRLKILKFDQPRAKNLAEVLSGVAAMAGAEVRFDRDELGPAAARLDEPAALKLENTTVGEILDGLLKPAGLGFRVEKDCIRLVPREG